MYVCMCGCMCMYVYVYVHMRMCIYTLAEGQNSRRKRRNVLASETFLA